MTFLSDYATRTMVASPTGMDTLWKGESRGIVKAA